MTALKAPKDLIENINYRQDIDAALKNGSLIVEDVQKLYKDDIVLFFESVLWTYSRREDRFEHFPFILYPFQEDFLLELEESYKLGRDTLVEKSRDQGVSWLCLGFAYHKWLLHEGFQGLIGSRKEDLVDKLGDMSTLFEKLRYFCNYTFYPLLPRRFNPKKHSTYMKMYNPERGNAIVGESTNANFGVGGRYSLIFLDEFSKLDNDSECETIWRVTADSSKFRMPVGTPNGAGKHFHKLSESGRIFKMSPHWTVHPDKNIDLYCEKCGRKEDFVHTRWQTFCQPPCNGKIRSPWYDNECERRQFIEQDIAQELDIDYIGSGYNYFNRNILNVYKDEALPPIHIGILEWPKTKARSKVKFAKFKEQKGGYLSVWEPPQHGRKYAIGADVAEGLKHGDFSCAYVIDTISWKIVACVHGKMEAYVFADILHMLAHHYVNSIESGEFNKEWNYFKPLLAVEANNQGSSVVDRLHYELNYSNLYRHIFLDTLTKKVTRKLGWHTNKTSKGLALGYLQKLIHEHMILNIDSGCVDEMFTFIVNNKKYEAQEGCNDDRVMALAITCMAAREELSHGHRIGKQRKQLRRR